MLDAEVTEPSRTVTGSFPGLPTSAAAMVAVSCCALTNVVDLALALKSTWLLEVKPLPLTVRVNPDAPCMSTKGLKDEIVIEEGGGGLLPSDDPPPQADITMVATNNDNKHPNFNWRRSPTSSTVPPISTVPPDTYAQTKSSS